MKYKKNLRIEGDKVYSYTTHVATIERASGELHVHGYWSMTTSKHINHVADVYGLKKVERKRDASKSDESASSALKSIAMVASLGNIFGKTQKESNDWKARMLKAGLEGRGLIMPDDWDTLDEDTKQARLDGAIGELSKANQ